MVYDSKEQNNSLVFFLKYEVSKRTSINQSYQVHSLAPSQPSSTDIKKYNLGKMQESSSDLDEQLSPGTKEWPLMTSILSLVICFVCNTSYLPNLNGLQGPRPSAFQMKMSWGGIKTTDASNNSIYCTGCFKPMRFFQSNEYPSKSQSQMLALRRKILHNITVLLRSLKIRGAQIAII